MPSAALLNTSGRSLAAAAAATSRRRHASSGTIQRPARMQPAAASGAATNGSNGAAPRRRLATLLLHSEGLVNDEFGASMPPIYQTATFTQPGATDMGEYDYSRSGNPTRTVLERQLAVLEVRGCCWGVEGSACAGRDPCCGQLSCQHARQSSAGGQGRR